MFSKIVPAFTSQNISALGPLMLVAMIYEGMGIIIAWLISRFFWVPHRFRYGILVAGGWSNWGDIPTAVVMSITGAAPFNGTADQTLSVAYIAGFLLVYMITFFPMGGSRLVGLDYVGPDVEPEEVQEATRRRRKLIFYEWPKMVVGQRRRTYDSQGDVDEKGTGFDEEQSAKLEQEMRPVHTQRPKLASKHNSLDTATAVADGPESRARSPPPIEGWSSPISAPTATAVDPGTRAPSPVLPTTTAAPPAPRTRRQTLAAHFRTFLRNLFLPGSVGIILAFIVALAPPLKALFTPVPSVTYIHAAPDGQPPLAFILDATSFIGAASVPMGLVCLGSALARLRIPRDAWGSLPTGAILALAVGKMLVSPVLGVLICKGLTHAGVINKEDKVLQFVCIFFSCLPTATTQVFVTQVYSGTGSAEHLSAFLIPQYILMLPSMTALTAYTLQTLF